MEGRAAEVWAFKERQRIETDAWWATQGASWENWNEFHAKRNAALKAFLTKEEWAQEGAIERENHNSPFGQVEKELTSSK